MWRMLALAYTVFWIYLLTRIEFWNAVGIIFVTWGLFILLPLAWGEIWE